MPPPVVAAKRTTAHSDPYAAKPLTSKSRSLLRSPSTASHASSNGSLQSRTPSQQSRASSTGTARSAATARSTGSVRSLSREEVRERMSRPPDVPIAKGGAVNMRSATPEFIQTFWAGMKRDCDEFAARRREKLLREAEENEQSAQQAAPPSATTGKRPVIKASVTRRPSQERPQSQPARSEVSQIHVRAQEPANQQRPAPSASPEPEVHTRRAGSRPSLTQQKPIGQAPKSVANTKSRSETQTGALLPPGRRPAGAAPRQDTSAQTKGPAAATRPPSATRGKTIPAATAPAARKDAKTSPTPVAAVTRTTSQRSSASKASNASAATGRVRSTPAKKLLEN